VERIARHYGISGVLDAILDGLRAEGKDLDRLTADDLAPVDELHIRGREATVELARLAGAKPGLRVLDVGSGLGGSSRYLASNHGCRVTGVDLTPEYCEIATELSRRVGLDGLTDFRCASALETPFEDGAFDVAWTQHAQMNIEDKAGLYEEIFRVLRPGGRLVFHDILAGPVGPIHFPVHWAEDPLMSFLIAPDDLRTLLEETGFEVVEWIDKTQMSREWFLGMVEERGDGPPPNLGLHLLIGETGPAKVQSVARNLKEDRITVFQGVLERP
jgi:SAM-dependent methyltransferase